MENILVGVSVVFFVIMVLLSIALPIMVLPHHLGRDKKLFTYDTWNVKETKRQELTSSKQQEDEKKKVDYQDFKELKESHAELYIKFINLEQRLKELEEQVNK